MALAIAEESEPRDVMLWRVLAFCGRYGHQPIQYLRKLPVTELMRFAGALGTLLYEERDAMKAATDS